MHLPQNGFEFDSHVYSFFHGCLNYRAIYRQLMKLAAEQAPNFGANLSFYSEIS